MAKLTPACIPLLIAALCGATLPVAANNQLPDIGTAGVVALPIEQEVRYGDAFMRFARASLPIIEDPVLDQYLSDLGQRLLANADGVRFPFSFFLINDPSINAAAFLGGRVKVHTGLFLYADTESELASVLAHEITHVTQRHIARYLEAQASSSAMTLAGIVGSIALAVINPTAGVAALQTTLGLSMQSAINYTRDNEFEADRLGMKTLYDAGFDPMGMANFFQKLAAEYRYASKPPEMLLTHPLPETRISEARARAASYGVRNKTPSLDFLMAKARIQVRYGKEGAAGMLTYFDARLAKGDYGLKDAALYGKALALVQLKRYDEADGIMKELAERHPEDLFVLDTQTDIDLAKGRHPQAIARLQSFQRRMPDNEVVVINLANALLESGQARQSVALLDPYVRANSENNLAWGLLSDAYRKLGRMTDLHLVRAETLALRGDYQASIDEMVVARGTTNDKMTLARIEARISELEKAQKELETLKR
ncbi:beta-barrel assembly-enhancing protease [Aeromonas simiae]|uniref:beta-barrel assembly-enhancing protease n=1 Tax=Aeromonas simiae TaxID=218936 RepID=UPI00266BC933|nr:M48 family metalloprotease [Aeromonas simiae]MDO2947178.1 M48 family metalloprotease [Aeromonas simiae]MDO2950790.1 M48 family metalloprotease [Aeromonas simiae]MDO2954228.1 M48 family metalloprotease [Aeromonas simiae]